MPQPNEAAVMAALRAVVAPGGQADIVSQGVVSGIVIREAGRVVVALEVETGRPAVTEAIRQAAERAVAGVEGVQSVSVVLTAHTPHTAYTARPASVPADPPAAEQAGGSGQPAASRGPGAPRPVPGVATIIAVASGKGGVGKSTTAVNLALALRAQDLAVGILDADVYGPSLPRLLGIRDGKPRLDGQTLIPIEHLGLKAMSIGFLIAEDAPAIWRGPMLQSALQQMLWQVAWAPLDVLVVDLPPGTGDVALTLAQQVPLTGAVIVSTPQDLALIDARKGFAMFRRLNVPVLGIIENMSTFICGHCGQPTEIFGHGGARRDAARLGVPFLGELPLAPILRETSDQGMPIVAKEPQGPHAAAYRKIATTVWGLIRPA